MLLKSKAFPVALALVCSVAAAQAEIDYHVTLKPDSDQVQVEMVIPSNNGAVSVQMPSWAPGAYIYGNFYENVSDVTAKDSHGQALQVTHPDKNTWTVNSTSGPVDLTYTVSTGNQRRFTQAGGAGFVQISGPSTYMYAVGRKTEKCKISFDVPKDWKLVNGLDPDRAENTFSAPTYDVLADCPTSTGSNIDVEKYNLRGRDHYIVLEGAAKDQVDKDRLLKDCRFVSAAETDFFGNIPYKRYVWHFVVFPGQDGAGGLEHLNATQITLASGEGPRAQSVLSHEFFHLWNVKRIRPRVLGPFDYVTMPKTGNLWWSEGVTDYYANLLPYRYGEWKREQFFDAIVRNMNAVRSNPARLEISPYQASYRVAEANNGRGNSNGFEISYYNLGWLCGMCLDLEIRSKTHNEHSLDDVMHALWNECKNNQPGFAEDEIRRQCVRIGGPDLGPFYDKVVMTAGELPLEEQLAKAGLQIQEHEEPFVDVGFVIAPGNLVLRVHGPAEGKIEDRAEVVAINGHSLEKLNRRDAAAAVAAELNKAAAGTPITLTLKVGDDGTKDVSITPVNSTRKVRSVAEVPGATPEQIALRDAWLFQKAPAVQ